MKMHHKLTLLLGGLLVLQLGLAVALNNKRPPQGASRATEKLLNFDKNSVDGIRIATSDKRALELKKQNGVWRLSGLDDLPADATAVQNMLNKLADLKKGWPVATTPGAAAHFKLARTQFVRRITLLQGKQPREVLYLGSSPGFRKIHVRKRAEDKIYAVQFELADAATRTEDWLDKQLLQHPATDIQRAELPHLSLQRKADQLILTDLKKGEQTRQDKARLLLDSLANLSIQGVLGRQDKPSYGQKKPALSYHLVLKSGKQLDYRFSKPKDQSYYVLKTSTDPHYFKVASWVVDRIKDYKASELIQQAHKKSKDTGKGVAKAPAS